MGLSQGMQLGSCQILERIGAGGMGEVYRGRDTRLGRDVAVKALPDAFAHDADRMARFEREAQILASLNHPNLAIIHELKEVDGSRYLVLELVEGETLADRIARGPLPLDETLTIARQIAEGLEAAHERGVVHRDLKPSNIKITPEGHVKVLDFGLAKIYESPGAPQNLANSPTISAAQTMGGVILGTAAYMSPEQARGKQVDRRADIWAFGCVVYEMLTGRQAFPSGRTVSDTIASILVHEPDWHALPAATPVKVRSLLERCLRKDERRRWGDITNVRIELEEARTEHETSVVVRTASKPSRRRELILGVSALIFFLTALGGVLWQLLATPPDTRPLEIEMIPPRGSTPNGFAQAQISPDGRKIAFLANSDSKRLIWVRPLDSSPQSLPSTEGTGTEIFWSADSQYIGFSAEGKLKKVLASGGPAVPVANLPPSGAFAATWNAGGSILLGFETNPGGPLLRVPAGGGQPAPATTLDASAKEISHAYPHFLPDGRHFFYLARSSDPQKPFAAYVGELDSKERQPLPGIASEVQYSSTGHIVFIRDGALMAQPFDVKGLKLTGDAYPLADGFVAAKAFAGAFSVSTDGRVAYFRSASVGGSTGNTQLAWRDRSGGFNAAAGPEGEYNGPELSPNGKYVAFARGTPGNIWILDIDKNLAEPLTSDPADDLNPRWSPDGKRIVFQSSRDGGDNFYVRAVGVVAEDVPLLKDQTAKVLSDWSPDGKFLAYTAEGDVWALAVSADTKAGETKPIRITTTPAMETTPRISPDSHWITYVSNEPGQNEIYVQSFPQQGFRQKVSTAGGILPQWSRDGKELFYYQPGGGGAVMAVGMKFMGASFVADAPLPLFPRFNVLATNTYSVARDGRFLMQQNPGTGARGNSAPGLSPLNRIIVLLHWENRKVQ